MSEHTDATEDWPDDREAPLERAEADSRETDAEQPQRVAETSSGDED